MFSLFLNTIKSLSNSKNLYYITRNGKLFAQRNGDTQLFYAQDTPLFKNAYLMEIKCHNIQRHSLACVQTNRRVKSKF